ncbi:HAD-IC family P-type ATPase [Schaalia suimastitidis]|uniref:HAD-IC family P-type ATPase n=1 Tax=Schaalia suimastitidis TaxID=121163 RepID=UPI0003FE2747|nr:HAD-IC family P-type ATPase [Schaalia suimastitidis]
MTSAFATYTPLTDTDVANRRAQGHSNHVQLASSRSIASIIRGNVLTLFNGILIAAMAVVIIVGSWQDAVFGGVMIINAAIGIISEWRSKRTLDALAIVDAPRARVRRHSGTHEILVEDIVRDDLVELSLGDQVPVDGPVLDASGLEVDESMLTGESTPVRKQVGDQVLAGTSVVAGTALIYARAVGEELYAQGIARQARTFTLAVSEIQQGVNKVLRIISIAIIPVVLLTVWSQARLATGEGVEAWAPALVLAVAAVVGMIPQGLVLLTSMNFAIGSATLARKNVLMQELPAVEILARVDSLCLDKTGTLTTGGIRLARLDTLGSFTSQTVTQVLRTMNDDPANPTAVAIRDGIGDGSIVTSSDAQVVPFSSARKWAAWSAPQIGTWLLGAPEILIDEAEVLAQVSAEADQGRRVVALVHTDSAFDGETVPRDCRPAALVLLEEDLRPDATDTLAWFAEQDVRVRVISGDNPRTVAALAGRLGLRAPDGSPARACDARTLPEDLLSDEFSAAVRDHDIFGRVTPEQKRAMVQALQADGKCVAMTGDGVNDALALKDADLGIAMGNAARATKAVAQIVLLDGKFSQLPDVVARGRRIIANMERVSSLFFAKTTYASLLVILTAVLAWKFPFLPRHYTYIGSLTIGIPAFFIALGPNTRRYRPGFIQRTLRLAVPAGAVMAFVALAVYWWVGIGTVEAATAATLTMMAGGLWLLSVTARPLVPWRLALLAAVAGCAVGGILIPATRSFFAMEWPSTVTWGIIGLAVAVECCIIEAVHRTRPH